jgi:hypothetical protein
MRRSRFRYHRGAPKGIADGEPGRLKLTGAVRHDGLDRTEFARDGGS